MSAEIQNDENACNSVWRFQSKDLRNAVKTARAAHDTIISPDKVAKAQCEFCDRCFLPERLIVHNRSCTAFHSARKIHESPCKKSTSCAVRSPKRRLPAPSLKNYREKYSSYNFDLEHYPHALQKLEPESLETCGNCDRTFLPARLTVYSRVCTKEHPSRRVGQSLCSEVKTKTVATQTTSSSASNWRAASTAFREAIRAAKQKEAEAFPEVSQCPHCEKRFREKAGARHVVKCERIHQSSPIKQTKWRRESAQFRKYVKEAKDVALTAYVHINSTKMPSVVC